MTLVVIGGYISGVMALAGASRVFVFEPLPANQRAVCRLCELNPQLPINVIAVALGNINGPESLKVMPDSSMGKLASSSFQAATRTEGEIVVTVRQIDSLLQSREIPPPNVIKIDVEGAELDVLSGALEMLRMSRPTIFLEAHGDALEKACSQQLLRLGYKIRRIERDICGEESAQASRLSAMTGPVGGLKCPNKRRVAILTAASLSWNPRAFKEAETVARAGFEVVVYGATLTRVSDRSMKSLLIVTVSLSSLYCLSEKTGLRNGFCQSGDAFAPALESI